MRLLLTATLAAMLAGCATPVPKKKAEPPAPVQPDKKEKKKPSGESHGPEMLAYERILGLNHKFIYQSITPRVTYRRR
jgi:hypothetical protein